MAYKRISPMPIVEGGTNTSSFSTSNGVIYYDGTKLSTTGVGSAGQVLTSQGGIGSPPIFSTLLFPGRSMLQCNTLASAVDGLSGLVRYVAFQSTTYQGTTFASANQIMPFAATLSNFYVNSQQNTFTGTAIYTVYVNNVSTLLSVTVTGGVTGVVSDTIHTVSVNTGDLVGFQINCTGMSPGGVRHGSVTVQLN